MGKKRERRRQQALTVQQVPTSHPHLQMLLSKSRLKQPSCSYRDRAAYFWSSAGLLQLLRERTTLAYCCIATSFLPAKRWGSFPGNELEWSLIKVRRCGLLRTTDQTPGSAFIHCWNQTHYSQPLLAPGVRNKENKIQKPWNNIYLSPYSALQIILLPEAKQPRHKPPYSQC